MKPQIISRYVVAETDYDNAEAIMDSDDIDRAYYQNVLYRSFRLPIKTIKAAYDEQKANALQIDKSICEYAMSKVQDADLIKEAYRRLFYAQNFVEDFDSLVTNQQKLTINVLEKSASSTNNHQYHTIKKSLQKLIECINEHGIAKMDKDLFGQYAPDEAIECINVYVRLHTSIFDGNSITGRDINLVINTCNWIRMVHKNVISWAKMTVIDACLGRVPKDDSL